MKIKKINIYLLCSILFIMTIYMNSIKIEAASTGSITITTSSSSTTVGKQVTVTVTVTNSSGVSGAQYYLQYDTSKLKYISGDVSGSNPLSINFMNLDTDTLKNSESWSFTFEAQSVGTAAISIVD